MKKKIAFCFSWQARTLEQTYLLFKQNLFDVAKKQWFDFDIFCAVEDDADVEKVQLLQPLKIEKIKSHKVEQLIREKYEDFITTIYPHQYWVAGFTKYCYNTLQQFYKVSKSMQLKANYEAEKDLSYDIVLKLRFDAPFPRPLNFRTILLELQQHNNSVICNQHKYSKLTKRVGAESIDDIYFIMDSTASTLLANIFNDWLKCFVGKEITKYVKLHRLFNIIFKRNQISVTHAKTRYKNKRILAYILVLKLYTVIFFYTKFFIRQDTERWFLSFFETSECKIVRSQISIRIIKESVFYSVKGLFKKTKYEL